ncbi:hypothetical protein [Lactococcus lactis]
MWDYFQTFRASVKSKSENTDVSGYTALFNAQATLGMKNAALESCVSYLARLILKENLYLSRSSITDSDFNYALNVKPNPNQTASEFKVAMVKKLLNGELLVIRDNDKFYVADSFVTNYSLNGSSLFWCND